MDFRKLIFLILLVGLTACRPTAAATIPATDPVVETEEVNTPQPDVNVTLAEDIAENLPNFETPYSFAVSRVDTYTIEEGIPDVLPQPEAGQKWVVVTSGLYSESGDPYTVSADEFYLQTADGMRYGPTPYDGPMAPMLGGSTIDSENSVIGFTIFSIPADAVPETFGWCLSADCEQALTMTVP